jgi:molybdate transport system substrate-binding protein
MLKRILALSAVVATSVAFSPAVCAQDDAALVFAAASLKNALDAAAQNYWETTGEAVTISYAASSALAKQIAEGAPADIFFSADLEWMDDLASKNLIVEDSRVTMLGNEIVLVAPAASDVAVDVKPGFPLADALKGGRLAMALTGSVPAGKYGKASLVSLGVWDSVAASVAETENVRAALALVSRGEAALGIVYRTDAKADERVKVVGTFPADSHPPILYSVALTANAKPDAKAFYDYLVSAKVNPFFEKEGFTLLSSGS